MAMRTNHSEQVYKILLHVGTFPSHTPIVIFDSQSVAVSSSPYRVTELLNVTLELRSNETDLSVHIQLDEEAGEILLSSNEPIVPVYEYGRDEYPWRCGVYHYSIIGRHGIFRGLYEIAPKNISSSQMNLIHDTINSRVNGLIYDFLNFREQGTTYSPDLEQFAPWQFFSWYRMREGELLEAITFIERHGEEEYQLGYQVESKQKRQSAKAIMWQLLHPLAEMNNRYMNRKIEPTLDTTKNQLVKLYTQQILNQMQEAMDGLRAIYIQSEIELEGLSQRRVKKRLSVLQQFQEEYDRLFNALNDMIQRNFWQGISNTRKASSVAMRGWGYQTVYEIWNESKQRLGSHDGQSIAFAPTLRPTDQLYEYYVFFVLIEQFEQLGFEERELSHVLTFNGLEDGTYVYLKSENQGVRITFNEQVEKEPHNAFEKGTGFYSSEAKRKPDIRIDLYDKDDRYVKSTMIIEVKYRPFYNIYSRTETKEAMAQMSKYWSIFHVDEYRAFNQRVVQQVVCVYPGDSREELITCGPQGLFLQLYPESEQVDVGGNVLLGMISDFIH